MPLDAADIPSPFQHEDGRLVGEPSLTSRLWDLLIKAPKGLPLTQIAQESGKSEEDVEAVLDNNDYFIQNDDGYYGLSIFQPLRWGVAGVGKIRWAVTAWCACGMHDGAWLLRSHVGVCAVSHLLLHITPTTKRAYTGSVVWHASKCRTWSAAVTISSPPRPFCRAHSWWRRLPAPARSAHRSLRSGTDSNAPTAATRSWQQTRRSTSCTSATCTRSTG